MEETVNECGVTFEAWLSQADRAVAAVCGLGLDDLADGPSWDAWTDGVPPSEYAGERLDDAGYPA